MAVSISTLGVPPRSSTLRLAAPRQNHGHGLGEARAARAPGDETGGNRRAPAEVLHGDGRVERGEASLVVLAVADECEAAERLGRIPAEARRQKSGRAG